MGDAETVDVAVEQPVESGGESPGYQPPAEHEDVSEQVITREPEPRAEPSQGEGEFREISDREVTDALKELKRLDPSKWTHVVDRIRKDNFEITRYRNAFATSSAAEMAAREYQTIGGAQGLAALRDKEQQIEWVNQAAEAGDSSIIDDWIKDFPGGFREVMPYALKQYAQLDQAGFEKTIAPHLPRFLERSGLADRLSEAFDAIGAQNYQGAQSILRNIYAWTQAQLKTSAQDGTQAPNPEAEKLAQRENALKAKEDEAFRKDIGRDTFAHQENLVRKSLVPYRQVAKLSEPARARLIASIYADIDKQLLADPGFQAQVKAFLTRKDAEGTKRYIKGHLESMVPSVSKRVVQDLFGDEPKAAKAGALSGLSGQNGQKTSPRGPIRLNQKPSVDDIEKSSDYMAAFIAGRAVMAKGPYKGKLVEWR